MAQTGQQCGIIGAHLALKSYQSKHLQVLVLPPGSEILTTCMLDHRDLKLEFNFREEEKVAGSKVWQLKDKVVTNISCPRATAWATVQVADTAQLCDPEGTNPLCILSWMLSKTAVWSLDESQRSSSHQHQCFDPWWNYRCWHVGGQDETSMEGSKNSSSAGSSSVAHREMTSKRRNLYRFSVFTDAEPFDRSSYDGTGSALL